MIRGELMDIDYGQDRDTGEVIYIKSNHVVVNGSIYISKGKILGNMFTRSIENSEASQWILDNISLVRSVIQKRFYDFGVVGGDVDDCLDMILDDFNTREDLQFNKNHFGEDSGYQIKDYILKTIKFMVQRYKNNLENDVPLLNSGEAEIYFGRVLDKFRVHVKIGDIDEFIESDRGYWDELFKELTEQFLAFLNRNNYVEFNHKEFLVYMYLDVEDFNSLDEHYKRVAKKCGVSKRLIELLTEDIQESVKRNEKDGLEILNSIGNLLKGKRHGWKPRLD